jgi:hypothetical protein
VREKKIGRTYEINRKEENANGKSKKRTKEIKNVNENDKIK